MQICEYINVGKMWETPEKCGNVENMWKTCGKLPKKCGKHVGMWKTLWKTCGNVENMWKTCGKLICMYKCAKLSPTIQT